MILNCEEKMKTKFMRMIVSLMVVFLILGCPNMEIPYFPDGTEHYRILSITDMVGSPNDISIDDSIAFIALGSMGISIYDVSDVENPTWIGENSSIYNGVFEKIWTVNYSSSVGLCIITTEFANEALDFIHVTDTLNNDTLYTEWISSLQEPNSAFTKKVILWDDTIIPEYGDSMLMIFTAKSISGIRALLYQRDDMTASGWVNLASESYSIDGTITNMAISPDVAVVSRDELGISVLDLTNFDAMATTGAALAGELDLPGRAKHIAMTGTMVAVSLDGYNDGEDGIAMVDISVLESPTLEKIYMIDGSVQELVFDNEKLWIAAGYGGLIVLDVSDMCSPSFYDGLDLEYTYAVEMYDGKIAVADRIFGLIILEER